MSSFAFLHRYPFWRLVLPLAIGIYLGDHLYFSGREVPANYFFFALLLLLVFLIASSFLKRYAWRWVFGTLLFLFCCLGGLGSMNLLLQQTAVSFPSAEAVYHVRITGKPEEKERSILCPVVWDGKNVLLHLTKDSLSRQLQSGEELLVSTRLRPPTNDGNPDEFDYRRYLMRKQVSGTGFCYSGRWMRLAHKEPLSLRQQALVWRERILARYRQLGFSGDEFAVLSALTVGYKEELSEEIRETYSISGASHVLALSGLHIGFLYALLLFCFNRLPGKGQAIRWLRTLVMVGLLWAFAFFTGLSPSVVRSVIMCTFFALSGVFGRQSFSMNTLSAAAFFMLLWQPSLLFDVGFQLSFCAVTFILLLQPFLYRIVPTKNGVIRYLWGLMSVSIAAQLGTAPLVILYFYRFSTHFLLTNLMVIPLVSVIMYAAVALLALSPFAQLQWVMAIVVKELVQGLNAVVRWVEQLPWASIEGIWLYPVEVFVFYLVLLLGIRHCFSHTAKSLIASLSCLLFLCSFHEVMKWIDRPQQSLLFYAVRGCPAVHCVAADGRSWLVYADSLPDKKRIYRVASRHWQRLRLREPKEVTSNEQDGFFYFDKPVLSFSGKRVCLVNDRCWRYLSASYRLSVDYLYLCKGYGGRLEKLTHLFLFSTVILDASLSDYWREAYKKECRRLGFRFISLSEKGSVQFLL
ncbi:MAG: ComEC/Rec2 family competence protein [Bacteroides sp.]